MNTFLKKSPEPLKYGAAVVASGFYVWALKLLVENDNWVGASALSTILLAFAAFWSIRENRRIRNEDAQRASDAKALDVIQNWVDETLNLKAEYVSEVTWPSRGQWETRAKKLVSLKEYIVTEAKRFDLGLEGPIERISFILRDLQGPGPHSYSIDLLLRDLEEKCIEVLKRICNLRVEENL